MGNCLFGGLGEVDHGVVEVVTSNGGVMEFYAPISVGCITQEFPGHGIFRSHDLFWKPLSLHEELVAGQSYYLLPVNDDVDKDDMSRHGQIVRRGHVRSNSSVPASLAVSYRMSLDYQGLLKRSYTDVFSKYNNGRFWKVKLVISPEQLAEILSQEGRTQELIESVRTVAKCGKGGVSDLEFSDQWSLSSSWNASSKKEALVDMI
ncbi:hypothetical protein I3843_12G076000 [Carya illinoinensis]|uniref:Uncharacterized protein n=1 Tax=Carya illinoinensis TaxID=32201 RepID=A0A8T1NXY8_CARIL|nr:uncharacterized protein LOC122289789 [Carya illinoinensis]KAG2676934.1 hypothetical protein I3760_12G074100 [Carya illinoinensis]KAG6633843.1 hypothetical protein CIPAW_12G076300 [Carya illinoinensis]KAG6684702.1 hypothetical protein I3842_12G074900 [Carya illinoinensis]KAG7952790.1 hypothetical protein I3843_12G076000 [Carya illinoinensis]